MHSSTRRLFIKVWSFLWIQLLDAFSEELFNLNSRKYPTMSSCLDRSLFDILMIGKSIWGSSLKTSERRAVRFISNIQDIVVSSKPIGPYTIPMRMLHILDDRSDWCEFPLKNFRSTITSRAYGPNGTINPIWSKGCIVKYSLNKMMQYWITQKSLSMLVEEVVLCLHNYFVIIHHLIWASHRFVKLFACLDKFPTIEYLTLIATSVNGFNNFKLKVVQRF